MREVNTAMAGIYVLFVEPSADRRRRGRTAAKPADSRCGRADGFSARIKRKDDEAMSFR